MKKERFLIEMKAMNFEEFAISKEILKTINGLGYITPSAVQMETIPLALQDKDLIVKSQTGSGKTAAFAIPICEKIEIEEKAPQALVITPTRELAVQVKEDITNIGRFKKVRCAAIFGKQPMEAQKNELKQRIHVVVGTPGRIIDHIDRGNLNLERIRYLIIDEADEMLNMGFIDQMKSILEAVPSQRITMLFSATMSPTIEDLCEKYMKKPEKIEVNPERVTVDKIEQKYYEVEEIDKYSALKSILYTENPDSCILFCSTRENVEKLIGRMRREQYSCSELHGGMLQKDRLEAMEQFKRGEFRFLVATDVAARGMDIEGITHIINYDIPMEKESYVHRIGRTGRAGKSGKAITFVTSREYRFLEQIEEYIGVKIPKEDLPDKEAAEAGQKAFFLKNKVRPKLRQSKAAALNREITKIYIGAGKKKKVRAGDIVGAISNLEGVEATDIGIIDVQENFSYIDILNRKGPIVLEGLQNVKIKGKTVRVEEANK